MVGEIDSKSGRNERSIQRVQTSRRSGEIYTRRIELEKGVDEVFSGSSHSREPVGQFEMTRRRNDDKHSLDYSDRGITDGQLMCM